MQTVWVAAGDGDDTLDDVDNASDSAKSGAPEQRRSSMLRTDTDTRLQGEVQQYM